MLFVTPIKLPINFLPKIFLQQLKDEEGKHLFGACDYFTSIKTRSPHLVFHKHRRESVSCVTQLRHTLIFQKRSNTIDTETRLVHV